MKHFTIENETNHIAVHASGKDAEAVPNSERFTSETGLAKLATHWPMPRLGALWNGLPGVTSVNRFKDRATAIARIWKTIQNLEAQTPAWLETVPALVAPVPAPQGADVAPEASASDAATTLQAGNSTDSGIDKNECKRLLGIAGTAQRAYWSALGDLEKAIRFEMDDPGDLENTTVEELLEHRQRGRTARRTIAGTRPPRENSKMSQVIAMLKRPEGTAVEEIMAAMDWQKHTTRALLSAGGALTKKHGFAITTATAAGTRRYYITD